MLVLQGSWTLLCAEYSMAIKSLVGQVGVDVAGKAHNCQANSKHRIEKGDTRLKVRNGRSWSHYCCACGKTIISKDILKLTELKKIGSVAGFDFMSKAGSSDFLCR